jgi:hypothetical protein
MVASATQTPTTFKLHFFRKRNLKIENNLIKTYHKICDYMTDHLMKIQ